VGGASRPFLSSLRNLGGKFEHENLDHDYRRSAYLCAADIHAMEGKR
jgi:hypothetical protein